MIVAADGSGDFKTLQEAINAIPENNTEPISIYIKNGRYRQKVYIDKPYITLLGESRDGTILTFDDCANKVLENGEKMGTFRSYTIFIGAHDFTAKNITFENAAGEGKIVGQALAAYVDGDRAVFKNCRFLGHQDTIFTGPLPPKPKIPNSFVGPRETVIPKHTRQYYEDCYIEGDVDFIFGSATVVFNRCEIVSLDRGEAVNGFITAPSTPSTERYGYVFHSCQLKSPAAPETVFLGRPWREYGSAIFINCWMGDHIKPEGWDPWGKEENKSTSRFGEYGSTGPGANPDRRVSWAKRLTEAEIQEYEIQQVLSGNDGWNPAQGGSAE